MIKKIIICILLVVLLSASLFFWLSSSKNSSPKTVEHGDNYDLLRERIKALLVPTGTIDTSDPDVNIKIDNLYTTAVGHLSTMNKSTDRTAVWDDLIYNPNSSEKTESSKITSNYNRLKVLCQAYLTPDTTYYNNEELLTDIIGALDWLNDNLYNKDSVPVGSWWEWQHNWWDFKIGTPNSLQDCVVMLYDKLTSEQIKNYTDAVYAFTNVVDMTGANLVWLANVMTKNGILTKESFKIEIAAKAVLPALEYNTWGRGDGMYDDGSFIQHEAIVSNGSYGLTALNDTSALLYILQGSQWEIADESVNNIYEWVYNAFEPLIYNDQMMDMVRGRAIARIYTSDRRTGVSALQTILMLSQNAPQEHAAAFKGIVKYAIQQDRDGYFFSHLNLIYTLLGKQIQNDDSIKPRGGTQLYKQYPNMDKAVLRTPNFGFGLSMFSTRILNYETSNRENLKGWHTSSGATFLYDSDANRYSDEFWATVDYSRLPGVTSEYESKPGPNQFAKADWVGGCDMQNMYGVSGMRLSKFNGNNVTAFKSWFMFDDEVVALGSGITGDTANIVNNVETVIENTKLNSRGDNLLTVDGKEVLPEMGNADISGSNWAHLQGNVSDSNLGYYFPDGGSIKAVRETRFGSWSDVNQSVKHSNSTLRSNNYLTIWFDHTKIANNATYAYTLLPGKTADKVESYATNPNVSILKNTTTVQAVQEKTLGITAANFWSDTIEKAGAISCDKRASVMLRQKDFLLDFSISDPTMKGDTITVYLDLDYSSVLSKDSRITVSKEDGKTKLVINVEHLRGETLKAQLSTQQ